MTHLLTLGASFLVSWAVGSFIQDRCVASFDPFDIQNTLKLLNQSCQIFLMTVQEAHKEYNSLTDQIWAKYEQLDSGEFGTVDTPAFKAEACELANLLACVCCILGQIDILSRIELFPSIVLSSRVTNYKNDIHKFFQQFE